MSTFIGKYEAKADVKGRIFIPSTYRKLLPQDQRERCQAEIGFRFPTTGGKKEQVHRTTIGMIWFGCMLHILR